MYSGLKLAIFLKTARVTIQSNISLLSVTKKLELIETDLTGIKKSISDGFTALDSKILPNKLKERIVPEINIPKVQNLPPLRNEMMQKNKVDKLIELLGNSV